MSTGHLPYVLLKAETRRFIPKCPSLVLTKTFMGALSSALLWVVCKNMEYCFIILILHNMPHMPGLPTVDLKKVPPIGRCMSEVFAKCELFNNHSPKKLI